ncbi:MAG TPA: glycosyltransferase family 87 protein [Candidatus Acidoferrales bacterium]|nr:glycosyltransferase family 87 protein [Candidatus Acidoferrales bacterium]
MKRTAYLMLLLLTLGALAVHGYHPYAEDAEIYVPGIVKMLHPAYYPFGQEFFETHARFTLYPNLISWTVRLTHLPLEWALFLWYLATIYLLLLGCWKIAAKCFPTATGQWGAVAMVTALLTLPVAGTALYIFDEYLNPRSFSAFAVVLAIDAALEKRYWLMGIWLAVTAAIHPFMTVFGLGFLILLIGFEKVRGPKAAAGAMMFFPALIPRHVSAAFWRCLRDHRYYYLMRWTWYEWLGIIGALAILWSFARIARKKRRPMLEHLAMAVFAFGAISFIAGLIVTIPKRFEILTPYQPMRSYQLIYCLFALISGGMLGEFLLRNRAWRWIVIFAALCAGMCYAQLQLFPGNRHVEWPGAAPKGAWMEAFAWVRENTPTDAIFALDPDYMAARGENWQGFRAAAERSRMADAKTDWSAAVLFPEFPMADHVEEQVNALAGWKNFGPADFERLKKTYGVTWVVVEHAIAGMNCPYRNSGVQICKVN